LKDPLGVILRCLDPQEAQRIMFDFHENLCGGHHFQRTTAYKIIRAGYFWPTLFTDVCAKIRACIKCQKFFGKKQLKSLPLNPVEANQGLHQMSEILWEEATQVSAIESCRSFRTLSVVGPRLYWGDSSSFEWST
jgi:hypothetical protein